MQLGQNAEGVIRDNRKKQQMWQCCFMIYFLGQICVCAFQMDFYSFDKVVDNLTCTKLTPSISMDLSNVDLEQNKQSCRM